MISTKSPLRFINILLSYGIFACRYVPVTSKVAMPRPSCESIIGVQNNAFKDTLGYKTLYPLLSYILPTSICTSCTLYFSTFYPLFIRFIAYNALFLSSKYNVSGLIGVTTGFPGICPLSICLNYFITDATDFLRIFVCQHLQTSGWTCCLLLLS